MAEPLEIGCESLAVALIRNNADVTGVIPAVSIVRQSEDATDSEATRIVCAASPRQPFRTGRNQSIVRNWSVPVEVRLYATGLNAAQLATVIAGIQAAMAVTESTTEAAAIATAYSIGFCDPTEGGDFSTEDDARKRTKTWNFISQA